MRSTSIKPPNDKSKSKLLTTKSKADNGRSSHIQSDTSDVFSNSEVEMLDDGNNVNDFTIVTNSHKHTHQSFSSSSSLEARKKNNQIFTSNNRYSELDTNDNNENTSNKITTTMTIIMKTTNLKEFHLLHQSSSRT